MIPAPDSTPRLPTPSEFDLHKWEAMSDETSDHGPWCWCNTCRIVWPPKSSPEVT